MSENGHHPRTHFRTAIVGSGFSGLGMAIRMKQEGMDDFVVLEKDHDVGGTWHQNTYPGCQCDIASHLYSFSFAPNPDWTRTYSLQPEIGRYLRACAEEHGVIPHVRFRTEVLGAAWDDDERIWRLQTTNGELTANFLVGGMGALHEPSIPEIPGRESFEGPAFHSAQWDDGVDLDGKRVAVIGTGASAIQIVPQLQPHVEKLKLFQRTPTWVMPHTDRPTTSVERFLYRRFPALQRAVRAGIYASREWLVIGMTRKPKLMKPIEAIALRHLRQQVPDRELRRKLKPSFALGCKRILMSNAYYPALAEPNADVVTDGIREITPTGIRTEDGAHHEVDAIVFGTGFRVTDMQVGTRVEGRDGSKLEDAWQGSPQAYLGTTIAGFPNLFLLVGPNTGLGHNSMVYMIESQLNYVLDALRTAESRAVGTIEVRPEVQRAYNEEIQSKMKGSVWMSGCASWYIDRTGRNTTIWPDFTFRFRQRTRRFDPQSYVLETADMLNRELASA